MRDATRRLETSSALSPAQMEAVGELCDFAGYSAAKPGRAKPWLFLVCLHDASSVRRWNGTEGLLRIVISGGRDVAGPL